MPIRALRGKGKHKLLHTEYNYISNKGERRARDLKGSVLEGFDRGREDHVGVILTIKQKEIIELGFISNLLVKRVPKRGE